jgi:hypothetical protein
MKEAIKRKKIFRSLYNTADIDIEMTKFDSAKVFDEGNRNTLFMNRYNPDEMNNILRKVGLFAQLSLKGFDKLIIDIYRDDEYIHYLRIYSEKKDTRRLLVDLRLSESRFLPEKSDIVPENTVYDMFFIEWLQLQNPFIKVFPENKPQLPGQKIPGLGCLRYLVAMMDHVSGEVTRDGFLDVPDHFHLAVMYSKHFNFFNPYIEGEMHALMRDLSEHSLSDITWGVLTGSVYEKKSDAPYLYQPSEEIFPLSERMKSYFESRIYKRIVREQMNKRYRIDMNSMKKRKILMLKQKNISEM